MDGVVITWPQLLGVLLIFLLIYLVEMLLLLRGGRNRAPERSVSGLEQDVARLRVQFQVLREELDQLKSGANKSESSIAATPYSHAIKLARQGLDASAVASGCGISRGEAELIIALYRSPR